MRMGASGMDALSDFEALCDTALTVEVSGERFEVRQVRMHDLVRVHALCDRISPALEMPLPTGLLGTFRPELIEFLAVAADIPHRCLAGCRGDKLLSVLATVRYLNPEIFPVAGETESQRAAASQQGTTWAVLFAEMVRRGHRAAELPHYGLAQFAAYLRAANGGAPVSTSTQKKPTLRIVQ